MPCSECAHWVMQRKTVYDDGSEVVTFQAPEGKGHCEELNLDTTPEFFCGALKPDLDSKTIRISRKAGAPWQHWTMIPCPQCSGKGNAGDGACDRCAGTSNVRRYDDGFVGDERTRIHPKERELGAVAKPSCSSCGREVDRAWVACPFCGHRIFEPPAKTEVVSIEESLHVGKST